MLAYFYSESPLSRQRLTQVIGVTIVLLGVFLVAMTSLILGSPLLIGSLLLLGVVGLLTLGLINVYTARRWYALFFPAMTGFFIAVFSLNFVHQYITKGDPTRYNQWLWSLIIRSLTIWLIADL